MQFCATAIEDYDALVAALRQRRMDLGWTNYDLEMNAGLQFGYVSKLENYRTGAKKDYTRTIGPEVLNKMLEGLGLVMIVVDKENMLARASMPETLKNQASNGGKKRAEALSKKRRIAIARLAAKKRWARKRHSV